MEMSPAPHVSATRVGQVLTAISRALECSVVVRFAMVMVPAFGATLEHQGSVCATRRGSARTAASNAPIPFVKLLQTF